LAEFRRSYREEREDHPARKVWFFLAALVPTLFLAVMSPYDFVSGRFFINASIRVAHDPGDPPMKRLCETTEDGLFVYPSSVPSAGNLLVLGDSTSFWNRYPRWLEAESVKAGRRIRVLCGAQEGVGLFEIEDMLSYILEHNRRRFDCILIKASPVFIWSLGWPEGKYDHPKIGSGYSLRYSGSPVGASKRSLFDHFPAAWRRRQNDFLVLRRNKRVARLIEASKPGPDVRLVTRVPPEMEHDVAEMSDEYEKGLMNLIAMCRDKKIPVVFMTTAANPFQPADPYVQRVKNEFPSYHGKFSLITLANPLVGILNERMSDVCRREGIPLIHSATFLNAYPPGELWIPGDTFHIRLFYEKAHGRFIYRELRRMGF